MIWWQRVEESVSVADTIDVPALRRSDVAVLEQDGRKPFERAIWTPSDDRDLARRVAEPVMVEVDDPVSRWVEIRTASGRLITVIEVTSPSNKTAEGKRRFEEKFKLNFLGWGIEPLIINRLQKRSGYILGS